MSKQVEYNGVKYNSITEACKALNLSYSSISKRISLGMSFDDAVNYKSNNKGKSKVINYNGVVYKSLKEACEDLSIAYPTIFRRIKDGMSFEEAINYKPNKGKSKVINYNGVVYESLKEACEDLNINYTLIRCRMNKLNMTFEEAVNYYSNYSIKVIYKNREYSSIRDACRDLGLVYETALNRLKVEKSPDDVIKYCIASNSMRMIKINEELYKCKCKNCKKSMLLTLDLAMKHTEECCNE